MKMQIIIYIVLVLLIIVCLGSIIYDYNNIEISNYEYKSEKVPVSFNGYKILQLADLHSYQFGKDNKNLIEKINEINPDIIVATGDIIDSSDKNFDVCINLMKSLVEKYPVYYIFGNHELGLKNASIETLIMELKKLGIVVLTNNSIQIIKDDGKINICGLYYTLDYYQKFSKREITYDMIQKLIGNFNEEEFNILLAHNPLEFEVLSKTNADLIFSGHVHGGVIRLPWAGGVLSPNVTFFPRYDKGEYVKDKSTMIVSAGLGLGTLPFRIFNTPNIAIVTLYNK